MTRAMDFPGECPALSSLDPAARQSNGRSQPERIFPEEKLCNKRKTRRKMLIRLSVLRSAGCGYRRTEPEPGGCRGSSSERMFHVEHFLTKLKWTLDYCATKSRPS